MPTLYPPPVATISGVSRDIRAGRISCREALARCLERIDALEPRVRAWVRVDRQGAEQQARTLDDERNAGQLRGPLHGIPIGVKDIVDVAGLPTEAGFVPWRGRMAFEDAPIVERLRQAGAVIVGKTVTTPFAWIDPPPTRNPWNLDRTPGGSSSGSAAALACGMVLGSVGSQTGGSLTRPAAFCGVCALKPTHGSLDSGGIVPLSPSLDHPGVLARTVTDLALLWNCVNTDPETLAPRGALRLRRLRGFFDDHADPAMRAAMDRVVDLLRRTGLLIDDSEPPFDVPEVLRHHRRLMAAEAASWHLPLYKAHRVSYPRRIATLVDEGASVLDEDLFESIQHQSNARSDSSSSEFFGRADAFLLPSAPGPAPDRSTTGDPAFNSPWSYLGLPTVGIPLGLDPDGMPLGLQLVGKPFAESSLLAIARRCEEIILHNTADSSRND
jgi:aspartyl-tRNA(Asn)/glutamyl-tRNA(Gln) amidotransferase subunit A